MASIFRFKQFDVDQTDCAMKINTDGVLLASLLDTANATRILDIGTGTGVIALMLAQNNEYSEIEAVEIDPLAAAMAEKNFRNSIFRDRLSLHNCSFQELIIPEHFDLMVSNPPFYTDSLHNPDQRKRLARHTDMTFFLALLDFAATNLSGRGKLVLIIPTALAEALRLISVEKGLYCTNEILISSFVGEPPIRKIVTFERAPKGVVDIQQFVIYAAKGVYSESYKQALAPYFLAF